MLCDTFSTHYLYVVFFVANSFAFCWWLLCLFSVAQVDIELPEDMHLREAHNIGETLQEKLEDLPEVERAYVHLDFESTHRPEHTRPQRHLPPTWSITCYYCYIFRILCHSHCRTIACAIFSSNIHVYTATVEPERKALYHQAWNSAFQFEILWFWNHAIPSSVA